MKKNIITVMMLLATTLAVAQENNRIISGHIVDAATGAPIPGVSVEAYGNHRYTAMTDETGKYELKVPEYVSSVTMKVEGYNLQQVPISKSRGTADARLYNSSFTETYQRSTTAAVSNKADNFANTSVASVDPLIQQRLNSDVRSISRSGNIGMGNMMLMNGINSLQSNAQPLIVIDGVIMDMQYQRHLLHDGYFNNLLSNINVNDIESVSVMKNGTALYGAKGANGVLLINTKRNKSMATKIDVNINGRFEMTPRLPEMMDAEEYRLFTTQLLANKTSNLGAMRYLNNDPDYYYYRQYHNNTDWKDQVYDNAFAQNYGINVQGGDNIASYNLSVGYSYGSSTLKKNDFSRFNMRLNSDISVFNNFDVRFDAFYSDVNRNLRDDGINVNAGKTLITSPGFLGLVKSPFLSPYAFDKQGRVSGYLSEADDYMEGLITGDATNGRLANPTSILETGEGKNRNSFGNRMIMFAVTPKYRFNKHLVLSEHFNLGLINTNENYYLPILGVPSFKVESVSTDTYFQNIAQSLAARQTTVQSDTRLNWDNRYNAHAVNVMGGVRYISSEYRLLAQKGYNTGNDKTPNMSNSLQAKSGDAADDKYKEINWYAIADYNYAEKYYLQAGLSLEASSKFGKDADGLKLFGVKWGLFPSVEASWVISNERWLADVKGVDYLRMNIGFDVTGNDDVDYTASRTYFIANNMLRNNVDGKSIGNIGNTKLKWETTKRFTAGLEGNFINNTLNVKVNYFKSWTSDLLTLHSLVWTSGLPRNWGNEGQLENEGFDVSAIMKVLNTKNLRWEVGASVGHYKNKVTALSNNKSFETNVYGANILTSVGNPVGLFYGWKTNGVYATDAAATAAHLYVENKNGSKTYFQAGDMIFIDKDENGVINDADRMIIGDPNPDIYGNIFTTLNWKNWTLNAAFTYSLGNDIYNYQRSLLEGGSYLINQTKAVNYRWTTEGQITNIPRASYDDPMGNSRFSDRWIEDGSYLKLSSVTLSYYIPVQSTYLQGLTVWGSAYNLFTITKYLGSDPEVSAGNNVLYQGIDRGVLASGRSFSLGVNINL